MKGGMIDLDHVEKIDFIINNMLSPGLSMLAADPKIGKSWFALLMCLCVAQGRKFLGHTYMYTHEHAHAHTHMHTCNAL